MGVARTVLNVVRHPAGPPLVSVLSLAFVLRVVVRESANMGRFNAQLVSVFDVRQLVYTKRCFGPPDFSCSVGQAVDAFVASVQTPAQACNGTATRYMSVTGAQSPQQWGDAPQVFRFPYANTLNPSNAAYWRMWWAPAVYNFHVIGALIYVYLVSFIFQLWHARHAWVHRRSTRVPPHSALPNNPSAQTVFTHLLLEPKTEHTAKIPTTYSLNCFHSAHQTLQTSGAVKTHERAHAAATPQFLRWVEYALTSSVQILFFALLMQNVSVNEGMLIFSGQLLLCSHGYSVEVEMCTGTLRRAWFLHACPWLVHLVLWTTILDNFSQYVSDAENCVAGLGGPPDFVRYIIISQAVFFSLFGVTQLAQLTAVTRRPDMIDEYFASAETVYAVLNVFSKFFIAVVLITNTETM
tara:strand:+ start:1206 stop:2432 length:1227 start_codon:yes stop_codon:yes gene_type:complete